MKKIEISIFQLNYFNELFQSIIYRSLTSFFQYFMANNAKIYIFIILIAFYLFYFTFILFFYLYSILNSFFNFELRKLLMDFLLLFSIGVFSKINYQGHLFKMKFMKLIAKGCNLYDSHYKKMPISFIQFYHIVFLFSQISFLY